MFNKHTLIVTTLAAAIFCGCETVAITGRSQLNIVPDADLVSSANQSYAKLISSAEAKNELLKASDSADAARTIDMVNRVSDRIIDAAGLRRQYKWQVVVIKSDVKNAFVMPNGKIVVYRGIVPIARNEAGLAAIIGHEVAHVVAHHAAERMSQQLVAQTTLSVVDAAVAANSPQYRSMAAAAMGLGAQYGVLLPYSRQHESEADRIGQIYMAKAGYDPAEAIAVWERMAASSGKGGVEFMSTHPDSQTRQAQLRQWLPEAQLYYADRTRPLPSSPATR